MEFLLLILIYGVLIIFFFQGSFWTNKYLNNPWLVLIILSILFLIISILFGLINGSFGQWEDIINYKNWMQNLNDGKIIRKDPGFSLILNLLNSVNINIDFSIYLLLPVIVIISYLAFLYISLPQFTLPSVYGFLLVLPAQIVQESIFSSIRFGLASSFSFITIALFSQLFLKNRQIYESTNINTNLYKITLTIAFSAIALTTHIGSLVFFSLIVLSIFIDYIMVFIWNLLNKFSSSTRFLFINILFITIIYRFNNLSKIDLSTFMFLPGFYRLQNYIVQISLSDLSLLTDYSPPIHRMVIYFAIFLYFYILNSLIRFKHPTNLNKFANVLSIFSIICIVLTFSQITIIYPLIIRFSLWAFISLAFTSATLYFRTKTNNLNLINGISISKLYWPSFLLMNLFSIYLLISYINN